MLTLRRQSHLDSAPLQAPFCRMRIRVRQISVKRGVAAASVILLFVAAIASSVPRSGKMARPEHDSASYSDATLLLARTTGLSNPDEAKVLLEALENGALEFAVLSSALEEDASRKAAKIKEAAEREATRKSAEEKAALERLAAERAAAEKAVADKEAADKAAFDKAVAEKAAAEKTAAEKVAAEKVAAEKAAAEKAAAEKAAAEKAAAEKAAAEKAAAEKAAAEEAVAEKTTAEKAAAASISSRAHKRASQSLVDDIFDDEDENDEFSELVEDEDDWLWDDFDAEFDDDVNDVSYREGDLKRSTGFDEKRGEPSLPRRENGQVPFTKKTRDTLDRERSSFIFDEEEENEEEETEQLEQDDGFGSKWSPLFRSNQRPRSSHTSAAAADRHHFRRGRVGQERGGRGGGNRRERVLEATSEFGPRGDGDSKNRRSKSSGRT